MTNETDETPAEAEVEEDEEPSGADDDAVATEEQPVAETEEAAESEATESESEEAAESAESEASETEAEEAAEPEGLQAGDVIRVAYTAYALESEQLVDTTDPEVAEEEGVADEDRTFEPRVVVLGEGHLFGPVEEAIMGLEPGDADTVVVPAPEAFGEVDPDQVRTVSADKIPEDDRYPGAHVDIDGQHGFVETIIGGRARVDFNHPLAGEDIEYEFEILEEVDDREELASGLLQAILDIEVELWFQTDEIEPEADEDDEEPPESETVESLYIEATPQLTMNQQWLFMKRQIADQLFEHLDVERIVVQEILEPSVAPMGGMGDFDVEQAMEELEE
ncbi:MAG: FKBP-type peptidyl-prolyl cis-trans isomerase [Halobacteriota archaeon]